MTVTPAYGKDYKTKKEALHAWTSGADFILNDFTSRWDGKPTSIRDGHTSVQIRYDNLRKVCIWNS